MNNRLLPFDDINDDEEFKAPENNLVVYSRDWTVQTIMSQVAQENIDLNPKYQRRNAWKDDKRMRLIESLLLSYPVPEIVLAESQERKKSFIVIDGKQRLQTLAGMYYPEKFKIWDSNKFPKSKAIPYLSGKTFTDILENSENLQYRRNLDNADIRCTVISNYDSEDILYDIFYRLNTGSSMLSSQELRQVLNKGEFSDFLQNYTKEQKPIHKVLQIESSDNRLIDIDLMLRCLAFYENSIKYNGSQKTFLDEYVKDKNKSWNKTSITVMKNIEIIENSMEFLNKLIGYDCIGRRPLGDDKFDWHFNKMLFEVQVLFSTNLDPSIVNFDSAKRYRNALFELIKDPDFSSSLEATTKSLERYRIRFNKYNSLIEYVFKLEPIFKNSIKGIEL